MAVAVFIFHGKLYVTTCSVELQIGGVHAMNNVILTKWRIALSIDIRVLEDKLKNSSSAKITISSECSTQ